MNSLLFTRSNKPPNVRETHPVLVTISDASSKAFGSCVYVRWALDDGTYESRLLIGKNRVAPLRVTTIVRLELSAALLARRLRTFFENSLRITFERVIHIVDSQIVKAMISKDSFRFNTFVAITVSLSLLLHLLNFC